MKPGSASRPVYSTGPSGGGSLCPKCGWPKSDCRCSTRFDEAVPEKIVAKLRIEKSGRGGKTVTVIDGLPKNAAFLAALASELKKALGTGGYPAIGDFNKDGSPDVVFVQSQNGNQRVAVVDVKNNAFLMNPTVIPGGWGGPPPGPPPGQ